MRALKFVSLFVGLLYLLTTGRSFGQKIHNRPDTSQRITLHMFTKHVDKAIKVLETKKLSRMSDADHINIMMCINTFEFSYIKDNKSINPKYHKLNNLLASAQYLDNIKRIYPNYTWNRGLGLYFSKLKMELLGMPSAYAQFAVVEK